jgi:hypothetical protein
MVDIRDKSLTSLQPVIVITEHKGVIFGYADPSDFDKRSFPMQGTRVALKWGTDTGVNQLAETGPSDQSQVSAKCDAPMVHDIIKVLSVTNEAEERWRGI